MENAPVTVAAIANLKATSPDASFISPSPSGSLMIPFGIFTRPESALTATTSVGDKIAASANAAGSGMLGIIQWMVYPATMTVANTSPKANRRMGALNFHSSSLGVRFPSLNNSGAMNKTKNSSGFKEICKPEGKAATNIPKPTWINGTGIKGRKRLIILDDAMSASSTSTAKKISTSTCPSHFIFSVMFCLHAKMCSFLSDPSVRS